MYLPMKLKVRALEPADAPVLHSWRNDMPVRLLADLGPAQYETVAQVEQMIREWAQLNSVKILAFENLEGRLVGITILSKINWKDRNAELGVILDRDYWGKGLTDEIVHTVLSYAFDELGLHRIYCYILAGHERSVGAALRNGFKEEGTLRGMVFRHGDFQDVKLLSLLQSEYRRTRLQQEAG